MRVREHNMQDVRERKLPVVMNRTTYSMADEMVNIVDKWYRLSAGQCEIMKCDGE